MMYPSPDPRPEAIRAQGVEILSGLVLRGLSLSLLAQRAHWAVRGHGFKPFHDLFGEVYADLGAAVDRLAERAATLGAVDPMGAVSSVAVVALPSCDGLALCGLLATEVDAFAARLSDAHERVEEMRLVADANTVQSTTEDVQKLGWMLRSHVVAG